jgi:hypothetical protein
VKVTALIADSAQVAQGKLYLLGGGWSAIGKPYGPMALAILIEVPWNDTNQPHNVRIELKDADEHPVNDPNGKPIQIGATLEVGRPPGHPQGEPLPVPLAMNFGPLPLRPGQRYHWTVYVVGDSESRCQLGFSTRPN